MRAPGSLIERLARALFRLVLLVHPRRFRRRFGERMLETFEDGLVEARDRSRRAVVGFLFRVAVDLVRSGLAERLRPSWRPSDDASLSAPRSKGGSMIDTVVQDLRFTLRSLARRPAFTAVAVVTLALGIGADTAIFSVVNGVLLKPLPYADPDGLAMVWHHDLDDPDGRGVMSEPDLADVRALGSVEAVEGFSSSSCTLTGMGEAERIPCARVTGGLLALFHLTPTRGRDLRREENTPDAPRVAVVSHAFWTSRLGGDPDVVGSTLELAERTYEVVGVAPEGFDYPDGSRLWIPDRLNPDGCGRGCHVYSAVARIPGDVGMERAAADLERLSGVLAREYPDSNQGTGIRLEPLLDYMVGDVRTGLWLVLAAVGAVLLIACANVANLLLVRASTRRREVAVRAALGAGRTRLVGQVLTESLVLAALGTALGLALAFGGIGLIRRAAPVGIPRMDQVAVDGTVLAFAVGLTGAVTLLFGLSPALSLARTSVADHLGSAGRRHGGPRDARSRAVLLAVEVGLSLVLLVGAGLLLRTLVQLNRVELGFDGREVVRFGLQLPSARYDSLPTIGSFYRELEDGLAGLPGVEAAGAIWGAPFDGGEFMGEVLVEGRPDRPNDQETYGAMRPVTPGYFETMGLTLLRGRGIASTDRLDTPPVAVVNETFVRENFPGEDPLGKRFDVTATFGFTQPTWTVIGVVADVRRSLTGEPRPEVYVPHAQFGPGSMRMHLRGRRGATALIEDARRVVAELDPNLPLTGIETVEQAVRADMATPRFYLVMVGLFAVLAVVLAAVGLYGVISYLVSRRTREIGIRMALGARRPEITGLVLRQGIAPMIWGVALGLAMALLGGRLVEQVLFQVEPADPLVYALGTGLILVVGVAATLLPARRAVRVDPSEALRIE